MKKKLFVTLIITLTTLFCSFACVNAEDNIKVILNDEVVTFDSTPVIQNDRTLVPIRAIAEKMNFDVNWDQNTQTVTLENDYNILTLQINDYKIKKEHKFIPMNFFEGFTKEETQEIIDRYNKYTYIDVPSKVINDRTYLPLRAISELFGADVDWIQDTQTAKIFYAHSYGEEVTFEDDGIATYAKLDLLIKEFRRSVSDVDNDFAESFYGSILENENLLSKLSKTKLHKGDLNNVISLGIENHIFSEIKIYSLEDIKKLPNLKNLYIITNDLDSLSPITYIKEWDNIFLSSLVYDAYSDLTFRDLDLEQLKKIKVNYSMSILGLHSYENSNKSSEEETAIYQDYISTLIKISSKLKTAIKENITEDMTRREKIIAINKWICDHMQYDYNHNYLNSCYENNSPLHVLSGDEIVILHGYGVCSDYSDLFFTLCNMVDIPNIYIGGTAYGGKFDGSAGNEWGPHSWNLVQLEDGNFYHVDTTWNDGTNNKYLLLTDEEMENLGDHIWDKDEANEELKELLLYIEESK